jgi:hypothetical protein
LPTHSTLTASMPAAAAVLLLKNLTVSSSNRRERASLFEVGYMGSSEHFPFCSWSSFVAVSDARVTNERRRAIHFSPSYPTLSGSWPCAPNLNIIHRNEVTYTKHERLAHVQLVNSRVQRPEQLGNGADRCSLNVILASQRRTNIA